MGPCQKRLWVREPMAGENRAPTEEEYCESNFGSLGQGGWVLLCAAYCYHPAYDLHPPEAVTDGKWAGRAKVVQDENGAYLVEVVADDEQPFPAQLRALGFHLPVPGLGETAWKWEAVAGADEGLVSLSPKEVTDPIAGEDGAFRTRHVITLKDFVDGFGLAVGEEMDVSLNERGRIASAPALKPYVICYVQTAVNHFIVTGEDRYRPVGAVTAFVDYLDRQLTHELMHTFGLPHNCGFRDYLGDAACVGSWSSFLVVEEDK